MVVTSIVVGLLILIFGGYAIFYFHMEESRAGTAISATITTILAMAVIAGTIWYYSGTESGKREIKDLNSNTKGGIERVVTVYDVNGKEMQKYEGKFDVSYDSDRIKFDDEQGERHVIYCTTGTVIIDEK